MPLHFKLNDWLQEKGLSTSLRSSPIGGHMREANPAEDLNSDVDNAATGRVVQSCLDFIQIPKSPAFPNQMSLVAHKGTQSSYLQSPCMPYPDEKKESQDGSENFDGKFLTWLIAIGESFHVPAKDYWGPSCALTSENEAGCTNSFSHDFGRGALRRSAYSDLSYDRKMERGHLNTDIEYQYAVNATSRLESLEIRHQYQVQTVLQERKGHGSTTAEHYCGGPPLEDNSSLVKELSCLQARGDEKDNSAISEGSKDDALVLTRSAVSGGKQ